MGVNFYWNSIYGDEKVETMLRGVPGEIQPVWGLDCEPRGCAFSDLGKILSHDFDRIYGSILNGLAARCWRFDNFYAHFEGEEFCWPTLVIRQWMKDLARSNRHALIEEAVFEFATAPGCDDWTLINGLDEDFLRRLIQSPTFEERIVYDYHRFTAFSEALTNDHQARIYVIEEELPPIFWQEVAKRMKAAEGLIATRQTPDEYEVEGSQGQSYSVNVTGMCCTCEDFTRRGRPRGIHCKHLVACLRAAGVWDRWGGSIPQPT